MIVDDTNHSRFIVTIAAQVLTGHFTPYISCTQVVHFCPCDPDSYEDDYIFGCQNPAQAAAYVFRDKVWKGRQVLKVFFLNPEVLRGWRLTTDTILEWAGVWQEKDVEDKIPVFTVASRKDKADIRVMFSGELNTSVL